jgi:DNA primase
MIPPHLDFRLLKRAVSIGQVLADHGLLDRLRSRGPCWVGPCPLHGGDNPNAFVVHRERNLWRCFSICRAGGDVVELARRLHDGSYRLAARYLSRLAGSRASLGAPLPEDIVPAAHAGRPFRPFTRSLPLDPHADFLAAKGILPQTALRFEVGAFRGRGMLAGCIAVRLHDPAGQPLGYAGRRLADLQRGKWVLPPRLPRSRIIYGYHRLGTERRCWGLVLVECPWGVLRLAQLGIPAVALLGTQLCEPQRALLAAVPRVILLLDGDPAGRQAAVAIRDRLPRAAIIDLPDGCDPDDLSDRDLLARLPLLL